MKTKSVTTAAILLICFLSEAANAADTVDFEKHILPLFYQRCFSCHSESKQEPKGGLRLDSVKAIRESGVIVSGKPDESELLIRISLPHEDDSFMPPPEGGAQPFDKDELAMMKAWIRDGASFGKLGPVAGPCEGPSAMPSSFFMSLVTFRPSGNHPVALTAVQCVSSEL